MKTASEERETEGPIPVLFKPAILLASGICHGTCSDEIVRPLVGLEREKFARGFLSDVWNLRSGFTLGGGATRRQVSLWKSARDIRYTG
jgi:hypothetical protein